MRVAAVLEQCWHRVPGGTAATSIALSAALDRRDDVDVVGVSARHAAAPPAPWTPTVPVVGHRLPRHLLYESWHGLRWPRVEAATGPVDLCHALGGAVAPSRAPLVVTIHDLAFEHFPGMFTRHGLRFLRRAMRLARDEAAQVQVPSQATHDDCVAHGFDPGRLRIVPWGVEVSCPTTDDVDRVRGRFGLEGDHVVCVGTREPRKNLDTLVEAWRRLDRPSATLVLVGPEGWGDAADGSSFPANVTMTGFVDAPTRDALYAGAALSCYPSRFEGFGLPVLESMALGCPVVTSGSTATAELVAGGAGVTVDVDDPDAVAAAIGDLLDDPDRRATLAHVGRARAGRYTWEGAAANAVAGYREVLR